MNPTLKRREFIRFAAFGGIVFASGLHAETATGAVTMRPGGDFYFVQLSDTHWGYEGAANPEARGTLPKAIEAVNALSVPPDFIVFTGDLTHLTINATERRTRMAGFRDIVSKLKVRDIHFLPGEHDASLDHGEAFREFFGPTHYSFKHKGIYFVVIDNVSDPNGAIGDEQLAWLAGELAPLPKSQPIVVLTHRPLFDLYPDWGWATKDGSRAIALLAPFSAVTVFYGHIHQEHQHMTGNIPHYAAKSLIFPLPSPGSTPDHKPIPWDPKQPYQGLGWREIGVDGKQARYDVREIPVLPS